MKLTVLCTFLALGFAATALGQNQPGAPKPEFKTLKEKASYTIGTQIGSGIRDQGFDLDINLIAAGIRDAIAGKPALSEAEMRETMGAFQQQAMAAQAEKGKVESEKNKKDGAAFLAENKGKQGVQTLPSGMQYQVLKQGTGKKPTAKDTVTTHYTGQLLSGKVFDSSVQRGEPATFPVGGVIAGWTEALQLMPVGSKWKLFIPSDLAYGPDGRPPVIGPNALLIFEVELLGIEGGAGQPKEQ